MHDIVSKGNDFGDAGLITITDMSSSPSPL
jgi:hypothetical protein